MSRRDALAASALAVFVVALAGWLVAQGVRVTQEDGFYYLKIAQNLAAGRGSTFDGLHATNGYQPLWLLCLTPLYRALPSPERALAAATLLQAALLASAAVLVYRLDRRALGHLPSALAAAVFLLLTFRVALSGVEFALNAALLAAIACALQRQEPARAPSPAACAAMGLLLGLALLARLDTALLAGLVLLDWLPRLRAAPARGAAAAALGLPLLLLGGGYAAVNLALFGHALPVSGVAKRAWSLHLLAQDPVYQRAGWLAAKAVQLAHPLRHPLGAGMPALLLGGAASAVLLAGPRAAGDAGARLRPLRPLLLFALLQPLAYVLAYHGHYSFAPWYYAAQPLLAALGVGALAAAAARRAPGPAAVAAAAACAAALAACVAGAARARGAAAEADGPLYVAARWTRDHLGADARVGTWNAGAIGYLSGRQVVNLDGVVNTFSFLQRDQYDLCDYWRRTGITHVVDVFEAREGSTAMTGATLPVPAFYARCADRLELVWSERPPGNPGWPKAFRLRPESAP